jgi:Protein of unknown function (DUF4038)
MSLRVAPSGDHLVRADSPFILCADTVWSAFADAEREEWRRYLRQRASQGFNAILVSVLPIVGDRSVSPRTRPAFRDTGQRPGPGLDPGYLRTAVDLTDAAAAAGLTPVLVLAWYNYLAGERGAAAGGQHILSGDALGGYLDAVITAFAPYDPIYAISGDESFTRGEAGPYPDLLSAVRKRAPGSLITMHTTPETVLPAGLAGPAGLSFYAYQSGHYQDQRDLPVKLAQQYLDLAPGKPVMNLEPCYEGHGYGHGAGRFSAADVRRALWSSLSAGASAGLGYGAHGLWQWHRPDGHFNGAGFSGTPFTWDVALEFPGAWAAGLAAKLVAEHGLYRCRPAQHLVDAPLGQVRALATTDLSSLAIYTPYPSEVFVAADLSSRVISAVDLARGRPFRPRITRVDGRARIDLPDFNGDALYLFQDRA